MRRVLNIVLLHSLLMFFSCSQSTENPGQCALNCSSSIIMGADPAFEISTLNTGITLACSAISSNLSGNVTAQFTIWDKDMNGAVEVGRTPVPNISISPIVNGVLSVSKTHPENVQGPFSKGSLMPNGQPAPEDDSYYPLKNLGIITPKSNWCSDSCGVVTIEVAPVCVENNIVTIQIASGAKFSKDAAVITVKVPTP